MMTDFQGSKNIVYRSKIYADGNVHIGDIYVINGVQKKIPLRLNTLPFIAKEDVIGREEDVEKLHSLFQSSDKVVLVNGLGGIGKTTLAKHFIAQFQDEFNYVAWVSVKTSIKEAFVYDKKLLDSLSLNEEIEALPKNGTWIDIAFDLIINRLRQLSNTEKSNQNLLIIDNITNEIEEERLLDMISLRPNWKVLATSRHQLVGFEQYALGFLSFENAIQLFYKHFKRQQNDELVKDIVQIVGLHTLTIELLAKTIQNNFALNLGKLKKCLQNEGLNISTAVSIKMPDYDRGEVKTYIFKCLEVAFDLTNFGKNSKSLYFLTHFSVLPPGNIPYDELSVLFGMEHGTEKSEGEVIDILNDLSDKGWLERTEDGYRTHAVIMDIIRQKEKPTSVNFLFLIPNIANKLKSLIENKSSEILKYLPYGQSILDSLQEETQPLLLLANNIFEGYRQAGLWRLSFQSRVKNLEWARRNSKTDQSRYARINFGVYLANLAISCKNIYQIEGNLKWVEAATEYQLEAVEIFKEINPVSLDEVNIIAFGYDALSQYYTELGNTTLAMNVLNESIEFKEKYSDSVSNESIASTLAILGNIHMQSGDYNKSEGLMKKAMAILSSNEKNHANILAILSHGLSKICYQAGKIKDAEKYQLNGILIFEENGFLIDMDFASYLENAAIISMRLGKLKPGIVFYGRASKVYSELLGNVNEHTQRIQFLLDEIKKEIT